MKLKIKLFVAFAFLAFAACGFLFSNNKSQAQTGNKNRDRILETVAAYKSWKQVVKPEKKPDEPSVIPNTITIGG